MKFFILTLLLLIQTVSAKDMSRTEAYENAYRELKDGSVIYVGACSTHQDYEGKFFTKGITLVDYFEPDSYNRKNDVLRKTRYLEKELIEATSKLLQTDSISDVDDLTVDKIKSTKFLNLDLYRLNIGVGGGNGMILIFNRKVAENKIRYDLISHVFDGDIEYCDSLVWLQ